MKLYGKTSFDTVESGRGNLCKGVGGLVYATAIKDEASDFAHFEAHRKNNILPWVTLLGIILVKMLS